MNDKIDTIDIIDFLVWDYTTLDIWGFVFFGWFLNIVFSFIDALCHYSIFKKLTNEEKIEYSKFKRLFIKDIDARNKTSRIMLRLAVNLIPTYSAWISFLSILTLIKYPGLEGLIKRTDNIEKFHVVQFNRTPFKWTQSK